MSKIYLFIIGFLLGGIIIYAVGDFFPRTIIHNNTTIQKVEKADNRQIKKGEHVNKQKVNAVSSESKEIIDTLFSSSDTSNIDEPDVETDIDNTDLIEREKLLKTTVVSINKIESSKIDTSYESILAKKMGKDFPFQNSLVVELWESPLDFTGYKLNKSKLILYGFDIEDIIQLTYEGEDELKLNINGKSLFLRKTEQFKRLNF